MSKSLGNTLRQNLIQIDQIICLHGCWAHIPEALQELFEDGEETALLQQAGFTHDEAEEFYEDFDRDAVAEIMEERELCGVLVKATIPCPDHTRLEDGKPVHASYTWGISSWKWVFADTFENAIPAILAWKDQRCLEAYEKQERCRRRASR